LWPWRDSYVKSAERRGANGGDDFVWQSFYGFVRWTRFAELILSCASQAQLAGRLCRSQRSKPFGQCPVLRGHMFGRQKSRTVLFVLLCALTGRAQQATTPPTLTDLEQQVQQL